MYRYALPQWRTVWCGVAGDLYVVFLTALELRQSYEGLVLVLAAGFVCWRAGVIVSVDWTLLLGLFMAMFIDVHLLTQLPALQAFFNEVGALSHTGLYLTTIGLSPDYQ